MNKEKRTSEFYVLLLMVFFIGFIVDVFFIKQLQSYTDWSSDIRLFTFLLLWILIGKISHFASIATFKLTLVFLVILSFFFVFFRDQSFTERIASWVYIYLATGVVQQLFEARKQSTMPQG